MFLSVIRHNRVPDIKQLVTLFTKLQGPFSYTVNCVTIRGFSEIDLSIRQQTNTHPDLPLILHPNYSRKRVQKVRRNIKQLSKKTKINKEHLSTRHNMSNYRHQLPHTRQLI